MPLRYKMDYENVVKDFAKRTKHNLSLIQEHHKKGNEAYEVTQLINSCLGLLVLPQQNFIRSIPETPIDELIDEGWIIPTVDGNYPQVKNLNELMRYMRNAIAHCNIEFISNSEDQLESIKIWNENRNRIIWKATLGLKELESLLDKFIELILEEA